MSEESDFRQALVARPDPAASRRHLPSLPQEGPEWFCMHGACVDGKLRFKRYG
ncbi:hypothetical protein [Pelomicrobium methylotrophicum]|uniref:hypothetical protein n=1 Tax=Pelomicrobium methylotrophicum TaxID=2602750 RepID=UPI001969CD55|nr:hypothetical protein [Pelomicrobium methylotrophicum]